MSTSDAPGPSELVCGLSAFVSLHSILQVISGTGRARGGGTYDKLYFLNDHHQSRVCYLLEVPMCLSDGP